VANLRETKRQLAASRKAHPAGKSVTDVTPAADKQPRQRKTVTDVTPTKISWKTTGEKDAHGDAPATGTAGDRTYAIVKAGDGWKATVKQGSKTTVLAENASGKTAWAKCVAHSKAVA
jgi:hypothetical protein